MFINSLEGALHPVLFRIVECGGGLKRGFCPKEIINYKYVKVSEIIFKNIGYAKNAYRAR